MLKNLFFYFELAWLCCRLFFHLLAFALSVLSKKISSSKFSLAFLVLLILLIWISNIFLLVQKNTPKIMVQEVLFKQDLDLNKNRTVEILNWDELEEKEQFYESLSLKKIENLYLYLNLYQLNKIANNQENKDKYLNLAKNINPQIKE